MLSDLGNNKDTVACVQESNSGSGGVVVGVDRERKGRFVVECVPVGTGQTTESGSVGCDACQSVGGVGQTTAEECVEGVVADDEVGCAGCDE